VLITQYTERHANNHGKAQYSTCHGTVGVDDTTGDIVCVI